MRNADDDFTNGAAMALANLDQRACARALLKDAHSVLEEILLPMSFPWSHPTAPFMRIPRDIEDMPGILTIGCVDPENKMYGKFDSLRDRNSPYMNKMAARRSNDPGVVELTTSSNVSRAHVDSLIPYMPATFSVKDADVSGELSLAMFQDIQKRKRMWGKVESCKEKTREVSFRLVSTSSRSTILDAVDDEGRLPLILAAALPREIQDGKRRSGFLAFEEAKNLGSYNCRQRRKPSTTSARPRAWVGRNRLIWSKQEQPQYSSNRTVYRSVLTGERLESHVHKRPLLIKVGLQLNGRLLSTRKSISKKSSASLDAALYSADKKHQLSYTSKVVNESIENATSDALDLREYSQCTLNIEKLFTNVSNDYESDRNEYFMGKVLKNYSYQKTIEGNQFELSIIPPRFDCIASEDGIISVCCTIPGKFEWMCSQEAHLLRKPMESYLVDKLCSDLQLCTVCLTKSVAKNTNTCTSCSEMIKRNDRKEGISNNIEDKQICSVCGLGCGVMVFDEIHKTWQHDVCRVWVGLDGDRDANLAHHYEGVCQLCSEGSTSVVRCAADNCHVRFHPYCALIASKVAGIKHSYRNNDPLEIDAFLSTQHELSMLRTSFLTRTSDSHPLLGKTTIIPVAFCGYHNPKRQADFFGLYPGGCYLGGGAMRIPPRREGCRP